jgi:ribose transport system substrate-binding protein
MFPPRFALLVGALLSAVVLGGCSAREPAAKYRIAVIPKGTSHDFWKFIHAGAKQAERDRSETKIIWDGPAKEDLRNEQQQIVERFTGQGVSAIVLAPCDRHTLVAPVEAALKKGIPVVIIDSGLELTDAIRGNDKYLGYVATDNRQGGVEAAKRMIELQKDKLRAKVLMLRYQTGSESTEQREAGFRDTIGTAANIEFIEAPDEAGATVDSAQKVADGLLSIHKELDGIFAPNESSTTGVLRALEVSNRAGTVNLVGFDASEGLINAMKASKLHGLVLQDPFDMAHQAVVRAIDFLEGKPMPADRTKYTNLKVATRENMNDPTILPLYERDLRALLGE